MRVDISSKSDIDMFMPESDDTYVVVIFDLWCPFSYAAVY